MCWMSIGGLGGEDVLERRGYNSDIGTLDDFC